MKPDELAEFALKPIKYFSHDVDAHDDRKCQKLIKRGGWAAYGRWWLLCEVLGHADGHFLKVDTDEDKELTCDDLKFDSVEEMQEFLDLLRDVGLIAADTDFVYSNRMMNNAKKVAAHKAGAAKTNRKRWGKE